MNIETTKPKREMLNYINVYRGLAILLIVAGHTMQAGSSGSVLRCSLYEILTGGTALFIFISGFLFQHLSSKFEYKTYLKKKWTNVVMPYIITAIPGIILCFTMPHEYGNPFDGLNPLAQIGVFLTTGRVHNVPTWYIPMIIIYFFLADIFLKLEKRGVLYKFLPVLLAITLFIPRFDIEPEYLNGMSYFQMYVEYVKYFLNGFIHFASLYVLGMYFSAYKEKIDLCYKYRWALTTLMLVTSVVDIYLNLHYSIVNGTISKIFLTLLVLGYLKYYDEGIKKNDKLNKGLDFIAKYSFGLFFVHWYFVFMFNRVFNIPKVMPIDSLSGFMEAIATAGARFCVVTGVSFIVLYILKKILEKMNVSNTRSIIGV